MADCDSRKNEQERKADYEISIEISEAALEAFFCINFFVVVVYWLSGGRISAGHLQIGDITAVIEYAMMVLFFLMMAQMVILTLPRALECCE